MEATTEHPDFGSLVKVTLGKRGYNSSTKEHRCLKCFQRFDHKWELDRHVKDAHMKEAKRVVS